MIELTILQYLKTQLTEPVYMETPATVPARYVLMEKTGSTKTKRSHSSTFAFQSYAESLYQVVVLNELVKSAVENLVNLDEIGSVKLNSDYNYTDTTTKQYRYQAVFDITHY